MKLCVKGASALRPNHDNHSTSNVGTAEIKQFVK